MIQRDSDPIFSVLIRPVSDAVSCHCPSIMYQPGIITLHQVTARCRPDNIFLAVYLTDNYIKEGDINGGILFQEVGRC